MQAIVGLLLLLAGTASNLEIGRRLTGGPAGGELESAWSSGSLQAALPAGPALRLPLADAGSGIAPTATGASTILRRIEAAVLAGVAPHSRIPLPLACRPISERLSYDSTAPPACADVTIAHSGADAAPA